MPFWVQRTSTAAATPQAAGVPPAVIAEPQIVGRKCRLSEYTKRPIPAIRISSEVIAFTSPDSTFAVTKRLFDAAKKSILIGIYDFSAPHVRELLFAAMARGVRVTLMLDVDSEEESRLFDEFVQMGVSGVEAPSCANKNFKFFASSHEKVIVIDDEWTIVQSGNYSDNSIPLNVVDGGDASNFRTGNRDTGLAIRSRRLAKLFSEILRADIALVGATPQLLRRMPRPAAFLVEEAPARRPAKLFPSMSINLTSPLTIQPILSPDNYMDTVPELLREARKSVLIEQQYIRAKQPNIAILLEAITEARTRNPQLDVRIVLGKVFHPSDLPDERTNLKLLRDKYRLLQGENIRFVNTDELVHCHNKMIVVDGNRVLVSSQNWSDFAVTKNREAGLWIAERKVAKYFQDIFETDWKAAFKTLPRAERRRVVTPQSLGGGGFIKVQPADYEEV